MSTNPTQNIKAKVAPPTLPDAKASAPGNRGKKTGSIKKHVLRDAQSGRVTRTYYEVRKRYTTPEGALREKKRIADDYAEALSKKREIEEEIKEELSAAAVAAATARTFLDLAAHYKSEYMIAPRYIAGKKVEGLRSYQKLETIFNPLVAHFANSPLEEVNYEAFRKYKKLRLATPVLIKRRDKATGKLFTESRQRSIAAVNRELALARRMMNVAIHLGWTTVNPFRQGDSLINPAHENKRMRILANDEEPRLLSACGERVQTYIRRGKKVTARDQAERRSHLRAAIVCALDTALRQHEQFTLTRADVLLDERVIRVREYNAKVERERLVPITERLHRELVKIFARLPMDPEARVFPFDQVNKSFRGACVASGILDFRWHDMRHTAIMWMLESGTPESEVMNITGHTSYTTFMRYVTHNKERIRKTGEMLDARRALVEAKSKNDVEQ